MATQQPPQFVTEIDSLLQECRPRPPRGHRGRTGEDRGRAPLGDESGLDFIPTADQTKL